MKFKGHVKNYKGFSVLGKIKQISELPMIFKRNVESYKGFSVLGKIRADC